MYLSNSHYFFTQQAENQQNLGLLIILNYWFSDLAAEVSIICIFPIVIISLHNRLKTNKI